MNTLISISDGLAPFIFCRKTERTHPMREAMDGKVVYFLPESAFRLWCFNNVSTFPYLYLDLACKQLCFPPRRNINRRNESTKTEGYYYFGVLMILSSIVNSLRCNIGNCKNFKLIFLQQKNNWILTADQYFPWEMATGNKRKLAAINKEKLWGTSQERIMERFRNHSGTIPVNPPKIWFRIQYGKHTDTPNILRIIPEQRHVPYSFYPCKRRLSHEPAN